MTQKEITRKYGVDFGVAALVEEYLREIGGVDETFLPIAVNTVVTASETHRDLLGDTPTLEEVKSLYNGLPTFVTSEYGDKFLLGYISFLMMGRTI